MTKAEELLRREAALIKFEGAAQILHDFVHGDKTKVINTESGPLPSLSKIREELNANDVAAIDFVTTVKDSMALIAKN